MLRLHKCPPKHYSHRGRPSSQPNHTRPRQSQTLYQEENLDFALGVVLSRRALSLICRFLASKANPCQIVKGWRAATLVVQFEGRQVVKVGPPTPSRAGSPSREGLGAPPAEVAHRPQVVKGRGHAAPSRERLGAPPPQVVKGREGSGDWGPEPPAPRVVKVRGLPKAAAFCEHSFGLRSDWGLR